MGRKLNTVDRMLTDCVVKTATCWNWKGSTFLNGYGRIAIQHRYFLANRVIYEHFNGPIPAGHVVAPSCKNKACVRPEHLEATRPVEVTSDSRTDENGHKLFCKEGHSLDEMNLYIKPNGRRFCKTCLAAAMMNYREKHCAHRSDL